MNPGNNMAIMAFGKRKPAIHGRRAATRVHAAGSVPARERDAMQGRLEGPPLNIRVLQEYIAFARVLNFSAAARETFMAQSTLSTHLLKLEKDLGVQLIDHGQKPSLTPCGKLFLEYAESIVCLFLEGVEATKRCGESTQTLTVEEPQNAGVIFESTIRTFEHFSIHCPQARINLRSIMGHTPISAIQSGLVDIAKIVDEHPWDSPEFGEKCQGLGIRVFPVSEETPFVWLQADHPLAAKTTLSIEDIRNVPVLVPADVRYDDWRALMKSWFERAGITPVFNLQVTETLMEFYMTRPGARVFILPESLAAAGDLLSARGMVSREIGNPACTYYVSLGYAAHNDNPLLPAFLEQFEKEMGALVTAERRPQRKPTVSREKRRD